MKFTCATNALKDAVSKILPVVRHRATIPVLHNLYLKANRAEAVGGVTQLIVKATDSDISVSVIVPAEVTEPGETTVPATALADILKYFKAETCSVGCDDKFMTSFSDGAGRNAMLRGINPNEFPGVDIEHNEAARPISGSSFTGVLGAVEHAISKDASRYVLNGVALMPREGGTDVVATDGRRMALVKSEIGLEHGATIVLPAKAVAVMRCMFQDEEEVRVTCDTSRFNAHGKWICMTTRLIDGAYPNVRNVLNQAIASAEYKAVVDREGLLHAVRFAALFGKDKGQQIVRVVFGSNWVTATGVSADMGEAAERIAVDYSGAVVKNETSIAMHPAYLDQLLSSISDDKVAVKFSTATGPVVVSAGEDRLGVVMPMRI